jgi:tetrahydromethanopterin S-methyltransferase subunit B
MDAKIFMSFSQLTKDLLIVFFLGIILGTALGALLAFKFKNHFNLRNGFNFKKRFK